MQVQNPLMDNTVSQFGVLLQSSLGTMVRKGFRNTLQNQPRSPQRKCCSQDCRHCGTAFIGSLLLIPLARQRLAWHSSRYQRLNPNFVLQHVHLVHRIRTTDISLDHWSNMIQGIGAGCKRSPINSRHSPKRQKGQS